MEGLVYRGRGTRTQSDGCPNNGCKGPGVAEAMARMLLEPCRLLCRKSVLWPPVLFSTRCPGRGHLLSPSEALLSSP